MVKTTLNLCLQKSLRKEQFKRRSSMKSKFAKRNWRNLLPADLSKAISSFENAIQAMDKSKPSFLAIKADVKLNLVTTPKCCFLADQCWPQMIQNANTIHKVSSM